MTNYALLDQEASGHLSEIQLELMLFYNLGFSGIVVSSLKQGNKGAKYCHFENTVKSLRCHRRCCCCCCCWWLLPVIQSVPGGSLFRRRPGKSHHEVTNSSWFLKFFMQTWNPMWRSQLEGQGLSAFSNCSRVLFHDIYNFFWQTQIHVNLPEFLSDDFQPPYDSTEVDSAWQKLKIFSVIKTMIKIDEKYQTLDIQDSVSWLPGYGLCLKLRHSVDCIQNQTGYSFQETLCIVFKFLQPQDNVQLIFFVIRGHTLDHIGFFCQNGFHLSLIWIYNNSQVN